MVDYYVKEDFEKARVQRKKTLTWYFIALGVVLVASGVLIAWYLTLPYKSPTINTVKTIHYSLLVVFLIFSNISTNNKLEQIEEQQKTLADSANQSLSYMQQLIWSQATEIDDLNDEIERLNNILIEAGIIEEPIEPSVPDGETDSTTTDSNDTSTDETTDNTSTESSDNQETTEDSNANQEVTTGTNEEGGNTGE